MQSGLASGSDTRRDPFAAARSVADTVLYEGFVLYPYRASARKNQLRWQFGVLVPLPCADVDGPERAFNHTEVIVVPGEDPVLNLRVRCLQVQRRSLEAALAAGEFVAAESIEVDGTPLSAWDEALDHEIDVSDVALRSLVASPRTIPFELAERDGNELVRDAAGTTVGRVRRHAEAVSGSVVLEASWVQAEPGRQGEPTDTLRLSVRVANLTPWPPAGGPQREARETVMRYSLVAAHTLLAVSGGAFISSVDPPEEHQEAVAGCTNEGTFPVLVGGMSTSQSEKLVLASPIILYDHPAIAPESEGDLCDATEIDEILALRVLTLTDEEKSEARATDPRSAAIIDRCDSMSPDAWSLLHGTFRPITEDLDPAGEVSSDFDDIVGLRMSSLDVPSTFDLPSSLEWATPAAGERAPAVGERAAKEGEDAPWWDPGVDGSVDPWTDIVVVDGVEVTKGSKVRLAPYRRADAHDLFTDGRVATVAGVFNDVDGDKHVAVIIDDDPARDMYALQGRFLYFAPDEVVPVNDDGEER
ncbi:MAG: hypothetical protein M3Y91_08995 [Actinomycetota bacterium]|nr:hypothetical protein [Actinomycetota bacterium]